MDDVNRTLEKAVGKAPRFGSIEEAKSCESFIEDAIGKLGAINSK